jgi:hypothetical protein
MPHTLRLTAVVLLGIGALGAASAAPEAQSTVTQPAVWQLHHAQFDYYGITSRYTCDGLENKVRQILEYLGARHDVNVVATGCPRGPESFSRTAWVKVDFSTLVAASDAGTPADAVAATWAPLKLAAQRPVFMGDGDCELVDHMRKLLTDNFSWRGKLAYRTDCPIETTEFHDYQIQGELLKLSDQRAH